MHKAFLKDSIVYLFFKGLNSIGWVVAIFFLTRYLSIDEYGKFIILNSLIILFNAVSSSWLNSYFLRNYYLSNDSEDQDIKKIAIFLSFISSLIISLFGGFLLFSFKILLDIKIIVIFSFWLFFFSLGSTMLTTLRAERKLVKYTGLLILNTVGAIMLSLFLISLDSLLENNLIIVTLSFSITNLLVLFFFLKEFRLIKLNYEIVDSLRKKGKDILKFGYPIILINFFTVANSHFDKFIINFFHGGNATGIYSASYALSEQSIFLIVSTFSLLSAPLLYKLWEEKNYLILDQYFRNLLNYYLVITIPLLLVFVFFYTDIAFLLIDSKFSSGFVIIPYISAGAFFVGLGTVYTDIFTANRSTSSLMLCYIYSFVVNIFINIVFTQKYSLFGPVIATIFSYITFSVSVIVRSRKILRWNFYIKDIAIILTSSLLCYIIYITLNSRYLKSESFLIRGGVFTFIFAIFFVLPILKCVFHVKLNYINLKRYLS